MKAFHFAAGGWSLLTEQPQLSATWIPGYVQSTVKVLVQILGAVEEKWMLSRGDRELKDFGGSDVSGNTGRKWLSTALVSQLGLGFCSHRTRNSIPKAFRMLAHITGSRKPVSHIRCTHSPGCVTWKSLRKSFVRLYSFCPNKTFTLKGRSLLLINTTKQQFLRS